MDASQIGFSQAMTGTPILFYFYSFFFLATPRHMEFPGRDQIQAMVVTQAAAMATLDP